MHRTTIMLPADLKAKATRAAEKMGVSLGEFIRQSLVSWLNGPDQPDPDDPLLADDAVFDGELPDDLAARHDRYLYGDGRDLH